MLCRAAIAASDTNANAAANRAPDAAADAAADRVAVPAAYASAHPFADPTAYASAHAIADRDPESVAFIHSHVSTVADPHRCTHATPELFTVTAAVRASNPIAIVAAVEPANASADADPDRCSHVTP